MSLVEQSKVEMDRELECSICLTEFKRPKQLPCLHTFCLECLKKYCDHKEDDQIPCPLCKTKFCLPSGGVYTLHDDDLKARLVLEKGFQEGRTNLSMCELCIEVNEEIEADSFCLDCRQSLCGRCRILHKKISHTKQHKIVSMEEKSTNDSLRHLASSFCNKHGNREIELYCCACKMLICVLCHAIDHSKHISKSPYDIAKQIKDLSEKDRACIEKCQTEASDRTQRLDKADQDFLLKVSSAEAGVRKSIVHIHQLLEQCEKEMLDKLDTIKKDVQKDMANRKDFEEFRSTALNGFLTYSRTITERGTDFEIIRAAGDLHRRAEELMKDHNKDTTTCFERYLKFSESSVASAENMQKLVGTIIYQTKAGIPRRNKGAPAPYLFNTASRNPPTQMLAAHKQLKAVHVTGQEPLTASMLSEAPPQEQKQMLGERLFPLIHSIYPDLAGKITGMLLEIDNSELLHMLEWKELLKAKVEEAAAVLHAQQAKEAVGGGSK